MSISNNHVPNSTSMMIPPSNLQLPSPSIMSNNNNIYNSIHIAGGGGGESITE